MYDLPTNQNNTNQRTQALSPHKLIELIPPNQLRQLAFQPNQSKPTQQNKTDLTINNQSNQIRCKFTSQYGNQTMIGSTKHQGYQLKSSYNTNKFDPMSSIRNTKKKKKQPRKKYKWHIPIRGMKLERRKSTEWGARCWIMEEGDGCYGALLPSPLILFSLPGSGVRQRCDLFAPRPFLFSTTLS